MNSQMRLFSDVGGVTAELFGGVSGMDRAEFFARFPNVKGIRYDSRRLQVAKDRAGELFPVTRKIQFKVRRGGPTRCDYRCMFALGPNCECQCGGANHARGDAGAQEDLFADVAELGGAA